MANGMSSVSSSSASHIYITILHYHLQWYVCLTTSDTREDVLRIFNFLNRGNLLTNKLILGFHKFRSKSEFCKFYDCFIGLSYKYKLSPGGRRLSDVSDANCWTVLLLWINLVTWSRWRSNGVCDRLARMLTRDWHLITPSVFPWSHASSVPW